jgi:putative ABC transport system ATP-binding protein
MALIELKHIKKSFGEEEGSESAVLKGISFEIQEGEFVAIMGPSGSGKSTLLNILGFLDEQTSGIYLFDGKKMSEYSNDEIAQVRNRKMGFVFQSFNLLPRMTVRQNVVLPLMYSGAHERSWDEKVMKAIEEVNLMHRIEHDPSTLSGGEKQRVAIARALVNDPRVIFADEPTGNLDTKNGEAIMATIQKLNREDGRTVILITHDQHIANYADRIIRIRDGMIESDGPK